MTVSQFEVKLLTPEEARAALNAGKRIQICAKSVLSNPGWVEALDDRYLNNPNLVIREEPKD